MTSIPSYYNNFKKNDEGEPEEMFNLKKLFLGLLGVAAVSQGAVAQQPPVNIQQFQVARQRIMDAKMLSGTELVNAKEYIQVLEKQLANTKKEEVNKKAESAEAKLKDAEKEKDSAILSIYGMIGWGIGRAIVGSSDDYDWYD